MCGFGGTSYVNVCRCDVSGQCLWTSFEDYELLCVYRLFNTIYGLIYVTLNAPFFLYGMFVI